MPREAREIGVQRMPLASAYIDAPPPMGPDAVYWSQKVASCSKAGGLLNRVKVTLLSDFCYSKMTHDPVGHTPAFVRNSRHLPGGARLERALRPALCPIKCR
jgi:hypothetical protein